MPASRKKIIAPGTQINRLTVVRLLGSNKHSKRVYACRCNCGRLVNVLGSPLITGRIKSCGCAKQCCKEHPRGSGFAAAIAAYRASKPAKKLGWHLTEDEFYTLTQQPCRYCGIPPAQVSKKSGSYGRVYVYNGIDRVDSDVGYTPSNTVPCCRQCNMAKRKLSVAEFTTLIKMIYDHALHKA